MWMSTLPVVFFFFSRTGLSAFALGLPDRPPTFIGGLDLVGRTPDRPPTFIAGLDLVGRTSRCRLGVAGGVCLVPESVVLGRTHLRVFSSSKISDSERFALSLTGSRLTIAANSRHLGLGTIAAVQSIDILVCAPVRTSML